MVEKKKLKIFTWNVHSGYLFSLIKTGHEFYVPIKSGRPYHYAGKNDEFRWPKNIHNIRISNIKRQKFDLIILQHPEEFIEQSAVLSANQLKLPKIYIHHAPWRKRKKSKKAKWSPYLKQIDLFVHIVRYNREQWIRKFPETRKRCRVIYHGIEVPEDIVWSGRIKKGIAAINDLQRPGVGLELWRDVSKKVPIDLYGTNSERFGGRGFIKNDLLREKFANYRAYFNPTTDSSLPMAVLEAMSVGLPVVTTATTELPKIIKNGFNGFISNDVNFLIAKMELLIKDKDLAKRLGENAKETVRKKFSMERFVNEWNDVFDEVLNK